MNKTTAAIIILVILLVIGVGVGAFYFGRLSIKKDEIAQSPSPTPQVSTQAVTLPPTTSPISSDWKTFNHYSGVTINYPNNWVTVENEFISEITFTPGTQDSRNIYNIIEFTKYETGPIFVGYSNSEWFDKVNNLTAPFIDQKETRTKIASGKVSSGEPYVIFTDEPNTSIVAAAIFKKVIAYILKDEILYQLSLDLYDQNGLENFKKMLPTAKIN